MNKLFTLLLLAGFSGSVVMGQKPKPRVENIRMDFESNRFEIKYDIAGSDSDSVHQIDLYVIDNVGKVVFPDSLKGDIGPDISAGKNKKIVWDIYREYDVVYGNFIPRIVLDGSEKYGIKGGPSNAFLSVLVPGLGDYFVADHRKMKIKPYYKTAFTLTFMGLGLAAGNNRNHVPDVMGAPGYYQEYLMLPDGKHIWVEEYREDWIEEPGYTEYWLFPYDSELFFGVGLAVWMLDVIWVAREGAKNKKVKEKIFNNLTMVPTRQGMALSYKLTF